MKRSDLVRTVEMVLSEEEGAVPVDGVRAAQLSEPRPGDRFGRYSDEELQTVRCVQEDCVLRCASYVDASVVSLLTCLISATPVHDCATCLHTHAMVPIDNDLPINQSPLTHQVITTGPSVNHHCHADGRGPGPPIRRGPCRPGGHAVGCG